MIDHLALQVADVERAAAFYTRVFAPLGVTEAMRFGRPDGLVVGLAGPDGQPRFWLGPGGRTGAPEVHVALAAPDPAAVDAVHAAAVEAGAQVLHEPRLWPEYHPGYYAVFLRDPDGNNAEAVSHR